MQDISMCNYTQILKDIIAQYQDANKWNNTEFEQMKRLSNSKVGDVGQDFIENICSHFNYSVEFPANKKGKRARQSPWDIKINGTTFELKTATEDTSGHFQFNHIRYHRPYEAVICLGISPNDIFFEIWSKADIATGIAGNLVSMEKGANASYKLTKRPSTLRPISEFNSRLTEFLNNQ